MRSFSRCLAALIALAFIAPVAFAWPASLQQALVRDARRLVPRSLAKLIGDREEQILEEARRFPIPLSQSLAIDLSSGQLRPATLAALDAHAARAVELLREQRVSEGIVLLGATLRIPADLSDPVLAAGPEGYPSGVTREYYAFVESNLGIMPVTLEDGPALKLEGRELTAYWQKLVGRSREQSSVIRSQLFQRGRVVDHRALDYHSPVFAVAQISYSRAVTAIAATWLALWRQARGDLTRQPSPKLIEPHDAPPVAPDTSQLQPPPEAKP
jgi:hypothetical protein